MTVMTAILKRLFLLTVVLLTAFCQLAHADYASLTDSIRDRLPSLKGAARLNAYVKLQELSFYSPDADYKLRCLNELIDEAERQKDYKLFGKAVAGRVVQWYNYDMNDSVIQRVPQDIEKLKKYKQFDRLYEVWMYLVNTYIFSERYNMALREVEVMFADAKEQGDNYGMGLAYYGMGNVYANMHNPEQSADSYRKGLDMLKSVRPQPSTIADIFSYYGDLLNEQKQYQQLEKLTVEWKEFLIQFIKDREIDDATANVFWSYYYMACSQAALGLGELDKAEQMLGEVRKLIPSETDFVALTWLFNSAQLCYLRGEYQKALELNTKRLSYFEGDDDRAGYMLVISQRADILKKLGRYDDVAQIYQEVIQIKDSISGSETKNQLNEMNTLFHVDELKMEQERTQFRAIIIIVVLIAVALAVFMVFRLRAAKRLKKAHDELLVAYDQLEETTTAKERIESDLRIARNIQMGMVPRNFPERDDVDLYASMTPAKEVGGDLYGYLLMPAKDEGQSDKLYFALGDVSGKGVPASLFMAQATRLFLTLAKQQMMPAEICDHLNDALSGEDNETGMFVTMFVGLVDLQTGHLDFCNAGHNPPVLVGDGTTEFIEMEPNAPIGLWPGLEYVGEEIQDISNRPLFVYTDGLNEAENRQQEQFSDERLLEILQTVPFVSSRDTVEMLREEVEKHRDGAEPNDDLTMLCVKVIKN
jgi:serine phosphatase RsbU (regulator of sigma subunit)